jgi:Flp pilus assembly protein TadD
MLKRTLIIFSLTIGFLFAAATLQTAHGILLTASEIAAVNESTQVSVQYGEGETRKENTLVRVLKAPFKALGKLFGRGKDKNKIARLTEKDVEKFESAGLTRVVDAVQATPETPETIPASDLGAGAHLELGRGFLNTDKINEAIAELSLAASMEPTLAEAHNLLGVAYHRKGLRDLARKSLETALKLDKKNAQILNNLGYLLYDRGEYKSALEPLKKAARLAPDDARILNNLALTQSQLGKFEEAYKNFARAGGEIEGRLNIANRLEIAGLSDKAREHYDAARAQAEANQKNNHDAQSITVVMEIENGRVKYASISNPRPGLAAYEATALRIARGRRYAAGKNGQESIVLKIQSTPAS